MVTDDLLLLSGGPVPTVLIADDDADHRELMTLALQRDGHDVLTAVDAASAYVVLGNGGVDAALLDVRMPGESGIDLCRRLRAEPATAILPVMLISADVNDHRILAALHAGADDYLTKPFHRAELCTRLANLLLRKPGAPAKSSTAAAAAMLATRRAIRPTAPQLDVRRTA
jgi:DNA-binding response OmpR family regulator